MQLNIIISVLLVTSACSSPSKSLQAAQVVEAEEGRAAAIAVLDGLIAKWPESIEAPRAKDELGRLHYQEGLFAVSSGDTEAAQSSFVVSKTSFALDSDQAAKAETALMAIRATATPLGDPDSVLRLYEDVPAELKAHLSSWACEGMAPEEVEAFRACFTVSTSSVVDMSAEPPKGQDIPDLSEVGTRFDAMEGACSRAEKFIGVVCGEDRLSDFHASTASRRAEFESGIEAKSKVWNEDFSREWMSTTARLRKIAEACESDKKTTVRGVQRRFGATEFQALIVWHESAKNKSRAAYEVSDSIRQSYIQYLSYTTAVVNGATSGTTPECRDSSAMLEFVKRLWDECSAPAFKPNQDWITATTIDGCPFIGDSLR